MGVGFSRGSVSRSTLYYLLYTIPTAVAGVGGYHLIKWGLNSYHRSKYNHNAQLLYDRQRKLKMGHWNLTDYNESYDLYRSKPYLFDTKVRTVADVINYNDLDLLTITDISDKSPTNLDYLVMMLNHLNKGSNRHLYSYVISSPIPGDKSGVYTNNKKYAFVYDTYKLSLTHGREVKFYSEKSSETNKFTRLPGAVGFVHHGSGAKFAAIAGHFDDHGASGGDTEIECSSFLQGTKKDDQCSNYSINRPVRANVRPNRGAGSTPTDPQPKLGKKEAYDADKTVDVIDHFKDYFKVDNVFYSANTNIPYSSRFVFDKINNKPEYLSLFPTAPHDQYVPKDLKSFYKGPEEYLTVIGKEKGDWEHSMDNVFIYSKDFFVVDKGTFNLYSLYGEGYQKVPMNLFRDNRYYTKSFLDNKWFNSVLNNDKADRLQKKDQRTIDKENDSLKNLVSDRTLITYRIQFNH